MTRAIPAGILMASLAIMGGCAKEVAQESVRPGEHPAPAFASDTDADTTPATATANATEPEVTSQ